MLMLTQIYAEAWSQLDPDLADVIVAALPTARVSEDGPGRRTAPAVPDAVSPPQTWSQEAP